MGGGGRVARSGLSLDKTDRARPGGGRRGRGGKTGEGEKANEGGGREVLGMKYMVAGSNVGG